MIWIEIIHGALTAATAFLVFLIIERITGSRVFGVLAFLATFLHMALQAWHYGILH